MFNIVPNTDNNYRYKMNEPQIIKTSKGFKISNIGYISHQINHPVECIYKYISLSIGCKYDIKNGLNYNGSIDIIKLLQDYCYEYVLCPHCLIPEGKPIIYEDIILFNCPACGIQYTVIHNKINVKIMNLMRKILKKNDIKKIEIINKNHIVSFD